MISLVSSGSFFVLWMGSWISLPADIYLTSSIYCMIQIPEKHPNSPFARVKSGRGGMTKTSGRRIHFLLAKYFSSLLADICYVFVGDYCWITGMWVVSRSDKGVKIHWVRPVWLILGILSEVLSLI